MYQTAHTMEKTLDQIHRRGLVLPATQRDVVWRPEQVCRLFDSLMEATVKPVNATRRGCSAGLRRLAGRLLVPSLVLFPSSLSVAVDLALSRVNLKPLVWTQPDPGSLGRWTGPASGWLL